MPQSKLCTAAEANKQIMNAAIQAVKTEEMSQRSAAKAYGVSRSTLRNRLQNRNTGHQGGQTKFSPRMETDSVELVKACCDMGIPLNRYHCYQLFSQVAVELGLPNTACNAQSFRSFLDRHDEISLRITHVSNRKQDREWTAEVCEEYISKLQKLYDEGFLNTAEQVWNLDETEFDTNSFDRVVGRKGMKQIPSQYNGTAKECVTVLPCGNAAGLQLNLLALYSGKLHLKFRLEDTFNMCYHAVNEAGYMDQLIFANYIKEVVFSKITAVLETGRRVEIFCFPSGQTSRLQPFDVAAFGGIKYRWNKYLRDRRVKKGGLEFAFNAGTDLKSGFAQCGLFLFNPDMIRKTVKPYTDPSILQRGIRQVQSDINHDKLVEVLRAEYGITDAVGLQEVKTCVENVLKGLTTGMVLAGAMAKTLMAEAPKKKRLGKNTMLRLKAGALITSDEMVAEIEAESARKKAVQAAAKAAKSSRAPKRKAPEPEPVLEPPGKKASKATTKKPRRK
ncbi:hypothetical protein RvY_01886 [Ramazzottius varieornatus]|uniref:HTH psq-type domain-containing protein n=1 Tax=Ramazzottius varieornatus TaxID=947166 RepID=A0A1D1UPX9_RAMVA|nr:hypothetical protein RvY_01886 [Ramazzottius varieornatus]